MTDDSKNTTVHGGNVAMDGSRVRDQVTVHGDLNYLFDTRDDSAEEKLRVARNHLNRGDGDRAYELIVDAIARQPELLTAEVAYLWVLAILHGRSVDDLDLAEHRRIDDCFAAYRECVDDEWYEALRVIQELVACLVAQREHGGRLDTERFDQVMDLLDKLPDGRREEIMRHLDVLIAAARSDRADRTLDRLVDEHRMADDRQRRVPLFFEPTPVEPRRFPAQPPPRIDTGVLVSRLGGIVAAAVGALLLVATAARASLPGAGAVLALWAWSGAALMRDGWDYLYQRWRRGATERAVRDRGTAGVTPAAWGPPPSSTTFATTVGKYVRRWFISEPPVRSGWAQAFAGSTRGLQARLRREIVLLYNAPGQQQVRPERVEWLVRWHAEHAAHRWENGTLYGPPVMVPPAVRFRLVAALAAMAAGCLLGLDISASVDVVHTLLAAVFLVLGSRTAFINHLRIDHERRAHHDDEKEREQRFDSEQVGYARRRAELATQPDDIEMSRWLHWDRVHLRRRTMTTLGLTGSDLVTSFVLAEGRRDSPRARMGNGPTRYLTYTLRAFLLTEHGVRKAEIRLHFASGALNDEQRMTFPYRAISWAQMGERTVRTRGRRQAAELLDGHAGTSIRPVWSQKLALTLTSGKEVVIHANHEPEGNADGDAPDPAGPSGEDSGDVVAALRFLEAVVADGSTWVRRERRRRQKPPSDSAGTLRRDGGDVG